MFEKIKKCLLVGTDKLGSAQEIVQEIFGVSEVLHWDGRDSKMPKCIPTGVVVVVVYAKFINHNLMFKVKKMAKSQKVKLVFVKRGLSELEAIA